MNNNKKMNAGKQKPTKQIETTGAPQIEKATIGKTGDANLFPVRGEK